MSKISRRAFLHSSVTTAVSAAALGAGYQFPRPAVSAATLPIPPLLSGWRDGASTVYDLTAQRGTTEFFPGMPTPTFGYNGNLLGPVLRMTRGDHVRLNVSNRLGEPTTCHWHGLHVPAVADGGPHQLIEPAVIDTGSELIMRPDLTWQASFEVKNEAGTYWYHPHPEGHTGEQVYKGLAGMIIIDDPALTDLGLPRRYGIDDFPLVIQDRRFSAEGQLLYLQTEMDVMAGMRGDRVLVNGALSPTMRVPPQLVRLRLLNGSNARVYNFGLSDGRPFFVIASDGGSLPAPVSRQRLSMSNGERYEIVVDLSQDAGQTLRLMSYSSGGAPDLPIVDIVVDPAISTVPAVLPPTLGPAPFIDPNAVVRTRPFVLDMGMGMMGGVIPDAQMMGGGGGMAGGGPGLAGGSPGMDGGGPGMDGGGPGMDSGGSPVMGGGGGTGGGGGGMPGPGAGDFTINGVSMDMNVINETVRLGSVEEWLISNHSMMGHPFHIHDVQFLVRFRNGSPPPEHERGWKDTVQVWPGETVSVLAHFTDYADPVHPYMYHCHILEHEDRGMMGQFIVVP